MNIEVINQQGAKVSEIMLEPAVFELKPNQALVHTALTFHLNSLRQGTHSAKTRTEVSGGGHKPWKQKGTGRARAGSSRSPLWRHGGVIFPPKPRDHSIELPKKMRKKALANVISDKAREGRLKVVSELALANPKTKEFLVILKALKLDGQKVVMAVGQFDSKLDRASRNIVGFKMVEAKNLNVFDILNADWLVLTGSAVNKLQEGLV